MPALNSFKDEILDSLGEAIFTIDKNFRISFANHSLETITGFKKEELIGRYCNVALKCEYYISQCPIAKILEKNENVHDFDSRIQSKSGKIIPIRLNATVLRNGNDEPSGGVISFRALNKFQQPHDLPLKSNNFYGIVGVSKPMLEIYKLLGEIAETGAPVFVVGETGTGKEMIANAVQATSTRKDERFVKVNCSVLPPQLLASELFGHTRGAFTGAIKDRVGRFEFADHGTVFLDEIGEMPSEMQLQLLRILQDGTYERLGESITRNVDVRIIAATNCNIKQSVVKGEFRADLFYRLNVIPIQVPPLRNRLNDVPHLIKHFILKFSRRYKKQVEAIDEDALELLMNYSFPGNVRELENIIEYAFVRANLKKNICVCDIPSYVREEIHCPSDNQLQNQLKDLKSATLIQLLERHGWNQSKVARILGVNRSTIWRRLKALEKDK